MLLVFLPRRRYVLVPLLLPLPLLLEVLLLDVEVEVDVLRVCWSGL